MSTVEENFARWSKARRPTPRTVPAVQAGGEDWLELLGGGLLLAVGLRRGGLLGASVGLLGAALVWGGGRRICGPPCGQPEGAPEMVDESSRESFPASDPPSFTSMSAGGRTPAM